MRLNKLFHCILCSHSRIIIRVPIIFYNCRYIRVLQFFVFFRFRIKVKKSFYHAVYNNTNKKNLKILISYINITNLQYIMYYIMESLVIVNYYKILYGRIHGWPTAGGLEVLRYDFTAAAKSLMPQIS